MNHVRGMNPVWDLNAVWGHESCLGYESCVGILYGFDNLSGGEGSQNNNFYLHVLPVFQVIAYVVPDAFLQ